MSQVNRTPSEPPVRISADQLKAVLQKVLVRKEKPHTTTPSPDELQRTRDLFLKATDPAVEAIAEAARQFAREARLHAKEKLQELSTGIASRLWAKAFWLHRLDNDGILNAEIYQATGKRAKRLMIEDDSMVGHIARTRRGRCVDDVKRLAPEEYLDTIEDTRSAIGVPIIWGSRLLAVLDLESQEFGAFSAAQFADMRAAVLDLVPHLLVLEALDPDCERWCGWHPDIHGWDLSSFLATVCHSIRQKIDPSDGLHCLIWSVDHDEVTKGLFVWATTGHGAEFKTREILPFDSFNGEVAEQSPGSTGEVIINSKDNPLGKGTLLRPGPEGIGWETCDCAREFRNKKRGEYGGLKKVVSAPIYIDSCDKSRAVFSITAYDQPSSEAIPSRQVLERMTSLLGEIIGDYELLRREVAAARLAAAIYNRNESTGGFRAILNVLKEVLDLDAASIWARRESGKDRPLVAVATLTGFEGEPFGEYRAVWNPDLLATRYSYDPRQEPDKSSMTVRLANDPGRAYRRNLRQHFTARRSVKHGDAFPVSDLLDYRFLGLGFADGVDTLGVFRLNRSARDKRPFMPDDGLLLQRLAHECSDVIRDWRQWRRGAMLSSVLASDLAPEKAIAEALIGGDVPAKHAPETSVQELLHNLITWFQDREPYQATLVVHHPHPRVSPENRFEVYAYRSPHHSGPVDPRKGGLEASGFSYSPLDSLSGWELERILEEKACVIYESTERADTLSTRLRMPVSMLDAEGNLIRSVLAIDFARQQPSLKENAENEVTLFLRAAHRLAVIFGPASRGLLPKLPQSDTLILSVLPEIERLARQLQPISEAEVNMRLVYGSQLDPLGRKGCQLPIVLPNAIESSAPFSDLEGLFGYGVRFGCSRDGRPAFSLPLYLGPYLAAQLEGILDKWVVPEGSTLEITQIDFVINIVNYWIAASHLGAFTDHRISFRLASPVPSGSGTGIAVPLLHCVDWPFQPHEIRPPRVVA